MTISDIKALKEKYDYDYEVIAIRTQEKPFELGEIEHCSLVWNDGEMTEEELDGICATKVDSSAVSMHADDHGMHGYYYGEHQAIICGNHYEYGEDDGEVIISDPIVVEIIK